MSGVAGKLAATTLLLLASCAAHVSVPVSGGAPGPGAVQLNQAPPSDALAGGSGSGTVEFRGQAWPFSIGGEGVDGAALAVLRTSGEAYRLDDITSFPGTYRRAPADAIPAGQTGKGLWLRNEHGALLHLLVPPQGRMPDIGTDAVHIMLGQ